MTLLERDILAVVLSLNTVFMALMFPNVIPITYNLNTPTPYVTTLLWGMPLAAIGVWVNHRAVRGRP